MLPNPNPKKEREDARAQGARWSIDRFKLPANMNGRCRAKLQEWLDDRKLHRRPAYKTSRWVARAWKNAGEDEDQLVAAVDHSMAQEYTGIYAPGKTPAKPADGESWTDDLGRLCKRDPFGHLVVVRDA